MPHEREQFAPREISKAEEIVLRAHVERAKVLGEHNLLPHDWRDDILYSVDDCHHTTQTMVEVENARGVWGVMICNDCGKQVARECPHVRCDWLFDGELLRCGNCGCDAT